MKTYFKIDGLDYVVAISEAGDLAFALIGGASKKGSTHRKYDLFWMVEHLVGEFNFYKQISQTA